LATGPKIGVRLPAASSRAMETAWTPSGSVPVSMLICGATEVRQGAAHRNSWASVLVASASAQCPPLASTTAPRASWPSTSTMTRYTPEPVSVALKVSGIGPRHCGLAMRSPPTLAGVGAELSRSVMVDSAIR
jgi:hypothetical protein